MVRPPSSSRICHQQVFAPKTARFPPQRVKDSTASRISQVQYSSCPATISSRQAPGRPDRKSTRLNSSHVEISYAVFCLKKKKKKKKKKTTTKTKRKSAIKRNKTTMIIQRCRC